MNRTLSIFVRLCMVGMSGVFLAHGVLAAEPRDPRLEKVLADWQKRQHWFQAVEYKVNGVHKVPRGAYNNLPPEIIGDTSGKENPPDDVEAKVSFSVLLDFVKSRHRRDSRMQQFDARTGKLTPLHMKDAFNGTVMKCLIPKEENPGQQIGVTQPEMTIVSGNMRNGEFISECYPIFFSHGRIYTVMEPILPGQLSNNLDPDYLYIQGTGIYENRACLILRTQTLQMGTTSFDEYWVDTERECAIVRYFKYGGNNPTVGIGVRYQIVYDHWLPLSWRWTVYLKGKTLYYEDMRVMSIKTNPPIADADFELGKVNPGMLVEERTDLPTSNPIATPKSKLSVYRVKEDGEREEVPDPAHRKSAQYKAPGRNRMIWGILAVLSVATLGVLFWLKYRRR